MKTIAAQQTKYEKFTLSVPGKFERFSDLPKKFVDAALKCDSFAVPLVAGLHQIGVRSTYIWDCKLDSILSRQ